MAILDIEVWIKFLDSNYIWQTINGLQTQYQAMKPEYKESFVRYKERLNCLWYYTIIKKYYQMIGPERLLIKDISYILKYYC